MDAADLAERRLDELSGGRLQRAVTPRRSLRSLLLDKPTANPRYQPEVKKLVKRLSAGIAVVMALHDLTLPTPTRWLCPKTGPWSLRGSRRLTEKNTWKFELR
ncbi:MAG: hypothetical protein JHC20_02940 [Pyrobaculum sp.]|nr:hypothetical protein [Pyrobaculum sp.]